ncbi:MAG TPA: glycosyl transferase family 2 [Lentisphaeria bacterium]|nr:MAG: glycosyl transferase family 2 [Lentisphaerae bacterium GWF2_38_69]HBM15735.1 glycosyl transferase family 2 [Lentisphaeria bacterium]
MKEEDYKIDIIIPVFNEKDVIVSTLEEVESKVKTTHEIFIVYDFDEDNTLPVVKKYIEDTKKLNIKLLRNNYGRGVVNALKKGFDTTESLAALVVMGDLSDDLSVVDKMFEKIQEGYDIVCGSRYMKGGRQIGGPLFKGFLSRMAGLSLHWITGIPTHDISNSFKMYRTSNLKSLVIESTGGFEIALEVLVKTFVKGGMITEIPSTWKDRVAGKSNFKLFKWLPKYLKWYFYAMTKKTCFKQTIH